MHLALLLPLALLPFSLAKNTTKVSVGSGGRLVFNPETLTAEKGDTVEFVFYPSAHSVAESTFDKPCEAKEKGIFSGFSFNTTSGAAKQVFTVTVNDTNPIWLYCSYEKHCQGGMSMVINPPQDKTLKAYKDASSKVAVTSQQSEVAGGVISDQASDSSSSSMSSMSSSAASSASAATGTSASSTATGTTATATASGAVGRVNAGASLGALGLLSILVGGMV